MHRPYNLYVVSNLEKLALSRKTYLFFAISLLLYNFIGVLLLDSRFGVDYWEHLATISAFSRNLLNPENPYILSDTPTHLFTPYHFFWGAVARLVRIHPFYLSPVIGTVNIIVFLIACQSLTVSIFKDKNYTLLTTLTFLFFWYHPWDWSGFYNFGLLPLTSTYPYWFAFSISIILIAQIYKNPPKDLLRLSILALIISLIIVTHPIVGSALGLSLSIIATTTDQLNLKQRLAFLSALLVALLVTLSWPFFPILKTIMNSQNFQQLEFAGNYQLFYEGFLIKISPALLGLFFLFKFKHYKFITFGLVAVSSIYTINYFLFFNSPMARYIIFVVFYLHLGIIASFIVYRNQLVRSIFLCIFISILLVVSLGEIKRSVRWVGLIDDIRQGTTLGYHSNLRYFAQYKTYARFIDTDDVVLAHLTDSWILPAIIGCKVVGVEHSNPFLDDYFDRKNDTNRFFNLNTEWAAKKEILTQYNVAFILTSKKEDVLFKGLQKHLETIYEDEENILYRYYDTEKLTNFAPSIKTENF